MHVDASIAGAVIWLAVSDDVARNVVDVGFFKGPNVLTEFGGVS